MLITTFRLTVRSYFRNEGSFTMHTISKAIVLDGYKLYLNFDDSENRIVDLSRYSGQDVWERRRVIWKQD